MSFNTLPLDIRTRYLYRHLPYETLLNYCRTSQRYAQICRDPQTWYDLLQRDYRVVYHGAYPYLLYRRLHIYEHQLHRLTNSDIQNLVSDMTTLTPLIRSLQPNFILKLLNYTGRTRLLLSETTGKTLLLVYNRDTQSIRMDYLLSPYSSTYIWSLTTSLDIARSLPINNLSRTMIIKYLAIIGQELNVPIQRLGNTYRLKIQNIPIATLDVATTYD